MSPSRSTAEGARELTPKEKYLLVHLGNGLSKPTDNVGQQAKDNWQGLKCQSSIFIERTVYYCFSIISILHLLIDDEHITINCTNLFRLFDIIGMI